MGKDKTELLSTEVRHIDIKKFDFVSLVDQMQDTAFQARNLACAAKISDRMLADDHCGKILCLTGSLVSAAYGKGAWKTRQGRSFSNLFASTQSEIA